MLSLPLRPPLAAAPPARDLPLEGLRGWCALLVFFAHVFVPATMLDPRWAPSPRFWWFNLGYAAVLVFFVLSGYVIGLTTTRAPAAADLRSYLGRRALRLVPITVVAVLLSWALVPAIPVRVVIGHLLFLQHDAPGPLVAGIPLLPNNPNLWSLHYEAFYYLAFLALWRWAPRAGALWAALLFCALARGVGLPIPEAIGRLACGAMFWLAGLTVAWCSTPAPADDRRGNWPSALLALHAAWQLAPLRTILAELDLTALLWPTPVSPHRLDYLPACLWALLAVTGRSPKKTTLFGLITLGWCGAMIATRAWHGALAGSDFAALTTLALAILLWRWRPGPALLARLAPIGAISFAFYAVALPLQLGLRDLWPAFAGTAWTFTVRALAVTAVALAVAWLLEARFQPWLRRILTGATPRNFPREPAVPANPPG